MLCEHEKSLVQQYRGQPGYSTGYADGLHGRPTTDDAPVYATGHRAGVRAARLFAENGFSQDDDGGFTIALRATPDTGRK